MADRPDPARERSGFFSLLLLFGRDCVHSSPDLYGLLLVLVLALTLVFAFAVAAAASRSAFIAASWSLSVKKSETACLKLVLLRRCTPVPSEPDPEPEPARGLVLVRISRTLLLCLLSIFLSFPSCSLTAVWEDEDLIDGNILKGSIFGEDAKEGGMGNLPRSIEGFAASRSSISAAAAAAAASRCSLSRFARWKCVPAASF